MPDTIGRRPALRQDGVRGRWVYFLSLRFAFALSDFAELGYLLECEFPA
jgi:hypothetical protein